MSEPYIDIDERLYEMYMIDCRARGIKHPSLSDFVQWREEEYPELDEDEHELI